MITYSVAVQIEKDISLCATFRNCKSAVRGGMIDASDALGPSLGGEDVWPAVAAQNAA